VPYLTIKELPADERPRERMQLRGPQSLSNADLRAILLSTGLKGEPVTAMAERLLVTFGGLGGMLRADLEEIAAERGMGPAKATTIKAALELANRLSALRSEDKPQIASPDDVVDLLGLEMAALEQEQLRVVLLDTKNRVVATRTVYQGSANQAMVRAGEVFRDAVRRNAVGIIVVHNHPSGDPTPSSADVALTAELVRAGQLLDIEVIDHLIIGQGRHVSLRRLGLGFSSNHEGR
jgi:DNA repair protein RadC